MVRPGAMILILLCLLASGCMRVDDELRIAADGSATVSLRVEPTVELKQLQMVRWQNGNHFGHVGALFYPPLDEKDAGRLFGGAAMQCAQDDGVFTVRVAFDDIEALLGSPYGRLHRLVIERQGEELVLRGGQGMEVFHGIGSIQAEPAAGLGIPAEQLESMRQWRHRWQVHLPGQSEPRGWELAGGEGQPERGELMRTREVRAPLGDGFPALPAQLPIGLIDWATLAGDDVPAITLGGDDEEAAGGVEVRLLSLGFTSTYLYGNSWSRDRGQARLLVTLPQAQAPARWPPIRELRLLDDQGRKLNQKPEAEPTRHGGRLQLPAGTVGQVYEFDVRPPVTAIGGIASCSGRLRLRGSQERRALVPLEPALPADFLTAGGAPLALHPVGQEGPILRLGGPNDHQLFRMLSLSVVGGVETELADVQLFEADGQPWPVTGVAHGRNRFMLLAWGRPTGPMRAAAVLRSFTVDQEAGDNGFDIGPISFPTGSADDGEQGSVIHYSSDGFVDDFSDLPVVDSGGSCRLLIEQVETTQFHLLLPDVLPGFTFGRFAGQQGHAIEGGIVGVGSRQLLPQAGKLVAPDCRDEHGDPLAVRSCRFGSFDKDKGWLAVHIHLGLLPEGATSLSTLHWRPIITTCGSWRSQRLADLQPGQTRALDELAAGCSLTIESLSVDGQRGSCQLEAVLRGETIPRGLRIELLRDGVPVNRQHNSLHPGQQGGDEQGSWRRFSMRSRVWDNDLRDQAGGVNLRISRPVDLKRERLEIELRNVDLR